MKTDSRPCVKSRVNSALLGLHFSRFGPYERAVLGWLLSAAVVADGVVYTGRTMRIVDGSRVGRTKVHDVLKSLDADGVVKRGRVEGGVRIVLNIDAIEDHIGELPPVTLCTSCGAQVEPVDGVRHADDGCSPREQGVSATRTLGVRDADSLVRAGVTSSHSDTTYLRGGGDAHAHTPPAAVTTDTTTTTGEAGSAAQVAEAWAKMRGVASHNLRAGDVNKLLAAVQKHGPADTLAALRLIADHCADHPGRVPSLLWLPDRVEQVKADRKRVAPKPPAKYSAPTAATTAGIAYSGFGGAS